MLPGISCLLYRSALLGFGTVFNPVVFFLLICGNFLYILDMGPLSDMCIWNIFSQSVAHLFTFLMMSFGKQECFILMESLVPTLSVMAASLGPVLELCPLQGPRSTINKHLLVPCSSHFGPANFTRPGRSVLSLYQPLARRPAHHEGTVGSPQLCGWRG